MPGVIYLLLCAAFGWIVLDGFYPYAEKKNKEAENRFWVVMPASLGVGILLITWAVYGTAWFFYAVLGSEKPLMWSNGIVLGCAGLILAAVFGLRIYHGRRLLECRKLISAQKVVSQRKPVFYSFVCVSNMDHVLCILYQRRRSLFWFYGLRRLCAPYCNDALFLYAEQLSYPVSPFWRRRCEVSFYVSIPDREPGISGNAPGLCL